MTEEVSQPATSTENSFEPDPLTDETPPQDEPSGQALTEQPPAPDSPLPESANDNPQPPADILAN